MTPTSTAKKNGNGTVALRAFCVLLGTAVLATFGYLVKTQNDLSAISERLATIEANRFTSRDGQEVWRELALKMNEEDAPPVWFVREFDELKDRITRLEEAH